MYSIPILYAKFSRVSSSGDPWLYLEVISEPLNSSFPLCPEKSLKSINVCGLQHELDAWGIRVH